VLVGCGEPLDLAEPRALPHLRPAAYWIYETLVT
jgi:hypothetical protein